MFAGRIEFDRAETLGLGRVHHRLVEVEILPSYEAGRKDGSGILLISREEFFPGPHDTARRIDQAVALRVLANLLQEPDHDIFRSFDRVLWFRHRTLISLWVCRLRAHSGFSRQRLKQWSIGAASGLSPLKRGERNFRFTGMVGSGIPGWPACLT